MEAAFLLGKLNEVTYIKVPKGFDKAGSVAVLNSAIYGLSSASRVLSNAKIFLVKSLNFRV